MKKYLTAMFSARFGKIRQLFPLNRKVSLLLSIAAFFVGGLLFMVPAVQASTITISSNIATSTIWTSNNVYVINTAVTVDSGATLTIASGTVVKFGPNGTTYAGLNINGTWG